MNNSLTGVLEAVMSYGAEDTRPAPICSDQDSFEHGMARDQLGIRVRSRTFRSGRLTAVMSGVTVDLREATLGPDGATISVQAALSDIDIVPTIGTSFVTSASCSPE